MTNAALDQLMLILAREFFGVGTGGRMRGSVGIAFERDCRNADYRRNCEHLLERIIF